MPTVNSELLELLCDDTMTVAEAEWWAKLLSPEVAAGGALAADDREPDAAPAGDNGDDDER